MDRDRQVFKNAARLVFEDEMNNASVFKRMRMGAWWTILIAILPDLFDLAMLILDKIRDSREGTTIDDRVRMGVMGSSPRAYTAFRKADKVTP